MDRRTFRDCVILAAGIAVVATILAALLGLLSDAIWVIVPTVGLAWFTLILGRHGQADTSSS